MKAPREIKRWLDRVYASGARWFDSPRMEVKTSKNKRWYRRHQGWESGRK